MAETKTIDWRSLLDKANEFELRTLLREYAEKHDDFKDFVSRKLAPTIIEEDFDTHLGDVIAGATANRQTGNNYWEIMTDWSEIFHDLILPWEKEADKLSTEGLQRGADVIDGFVDYKEAVMEIGGCGD